jgi:hypothetical protein
MSTKRTLQLTHEQIETLKRVLYYTHDKKLEMIKENTKILSEDERKSILDNANKYFDLAYAIQEGTLDV